MLLLIQKYLVLSILVISIINLDVSTNIIDEIVLNLDCDEEIYLIKGTFKDNKIIKMSIYTSHGQFIEFGSASLEYNFSWEYYFNLKHFDGFIIGWNDKNITYLASLCVEVLKVLVK